MHEILIAFVSPVNKNFINEPIIYPDINGKKYSAVQTNESAVVFLERNFEKKSLSQIFLIVSDKVKNEIIPIETEFGNVTHLEFLKKRIVKEFPNLEGKFFEIDYTDSEKNFDGLEKNILQIAKIADAVTNYAKNFPDKKIKVHADMTGGFRHTSMLMLSIIQLLKYRGMEIGDVIYSDPSNKIVYLANEIQNVSLLITGADEFVKFGSVETLQEYFGKNPADAPKKLLDAMKKFSDTIKICRTNTLEDDLKNLVEQIKIFRESHGGNLKSQLFAKIIDTIESGYGKLVKGEESRIEIIRWCLEKGFWQQAMTLCTEWLPEEIVDRGIFMPKNNFVIKEAAVDGNNFGRGWKQHLIIAYQRTKLEQFSKNNLADFIKNLKEILNRLPNPAIIPLIADEYGILKKLAEEYEKAKDLFGICKIGRSNFSVVQKNFPLLYQTLENIYQERKKNPTFSKNFEKFLRTFRYDDLFFQLSLMSKKNIFETLQIDENSVLNSMEQDEEIILKKSSSKWGNRKKIYRDMLDNGVACSKLQDHEKILDLLHDYFNIRKERNQINHANSDSRQEISALKNLIEEYLKKLEQI